ncbi:MAG: 2-oxoacid ferredoxin oxidoreductase [Deltaproteobacteria bacterium]|nr:2-oxoacid ferredoxin oxidoreductase [Deltaproteobacteria bacterium]
MSVRPEDYASRVEIAWCPGCGNRPILEAVKAALVALDLAPQRVVICSGIGQAPKLPHYLRVNTFNGLHGRELVSACAVKMAAPDLCVLVHAGDGGAYGEGGNHLLHAIRRNVDLTLVVHDNKTYALTKGQASPTSDAVEGTRVTVLGAAAAPLNPLALAISQGCSFVARTSSALPEHLQEMIQAAVRHRGFSLLHVLQPCVVWDRVHTYAYYRERCEPIGARHDPRDARAAFALALQDGERIPVGIFYTADRPVYDPSATSGLDRPSRELPVDPDRVRDRFSRFR